ncbi:PilW family protein [Tepidibacter sp. Z1-5]|uniref:PilW family protein n=1 Tax=Tepidibacter sp. Z1-5 TaxID=3134138 RepID=UPI0030C12540
MRYILKNKKGFTLIELLIVLAITSIVIGAINLFFISNYKTFFRADNQITVQDEIQNAMNIFIDKARGSQGINSIKGKDNSCILEDDKKNEVKHIEFENGTKDLVFEFKEYPELDKSQYKTLYFGNSPLTQNINIKSFEIEPISNSYKDCKGIRVIINGEKIGRDKYNVTIEDEVYFRNYPK